MKAVAWIGQSFVFSQNEILWASKAGAVFNVGGTWPPTLGMSLRTLEGVFGSFPIFEQPYQYLSRCWGFGERLMDAISIGSGFNLFFTGPKSTASVPYCQSEFRGWGSLSTFQ
jgi:hypothetical protein